MSINFQELVLNGYFIPFNQAHLSNYFYREFKKAEKKYYDADEFFDGCLIVIKELIELYNKEIRSRKSDLETIFRADFESVLEIEKLRKGYFAVELNSFTDGKFPHRLGHHQISVIKKAINEAYQKARSLTGKEILKEEQWKLDPHQFLVSKEYAIIYYLNDNKGYDKAGSYPEYLSLLDTIDNLKPLRTSKSSTNAYLKEVFERLSLDKDWELTNFLLDSVTNDDTYCYAYNFFALRRNREFVFPLEIKKITEDELLRMLEKEKELHEIIKPILNPGTNETADDQSSDEMIKFAFDLIIIESLNSRQIQDFFEQKRNKSGHSKRDFAKGLFESFERLNKDLKNTDYCHLILTDLRGEKVEFLGDKEFSIEDLKAFQKMGKVSFPDKILDLKKYTNGLFDGKLTNELMTKLWKELKIYVQTITYPFNEVLKNGISKQSPEEFPPEGKNYNPSESTHKNGTNLFCNTMPLHIPKENFKVFTETKNKTGQPFLTEVQLNRFIERAFCGNKELPVQKFNHAPKGEKFQIQKVFYDFYCKGVDYFPSSRCRDNFIRLLTDNFIGWDFKNVKSNFAKQTR